MKTKVLFTLLVPVAIFVGWQILYAQVDSLDIMTINETTPNGPSFTLPERYGTSVSNIGDLNGDGVEDIAVGASNNDNGGSDRGAVYIHFMNTDGSLDSTTIIDDTTLNGPVLVNNDNYGTSVTGLGDLNGDGVEDIAVGASNNFGGMYISFLNTDGSIDSTIKFDHTTLNGPGIPGIAYGSSVENIGDLNNDGVIDIAVGATFDSTNGPIRGAVFIHFMNTDGSINSTVKINDSTVNGPTLPNFSGYGSEIAMIGDLNNDGVTEIAVSRPSFPSYGVLIHFMNTDGSIDSTSTIDVSTLNGPVGIIPTDLYGSSIEGLGDLNGDGVEDIAVGAIGELSSTGAVYIHYMNTDGSIYRTNKITKTNQTGLTIPSNSAYGASIANIGDYNNDGVNDVSVGAFLDNIIYIHFLDIIPDVTFTQSGGTTAVVEGGVTDTVGINLDLMVPTDDVTVTIIPNNEVTVDDTSFTFTSLNWGTAQFFTVTAVDDLDIEGTHTGSVSYILSSNDPNYDGITVSSTTVNITDNDLGVVSGLLVDYGGFADVAEDGSLFNMVQVQLTAPPTDDVIITFAPDSQLTLSVNELTFTSLNWNVPQEFDLFAVDDAFIEGNHVGLISYLVSSLDLNYNVITVPDASFNIADNDVGVVVSETNSTTAVTEGGTTDTFSVVMSTQLTDDVVVTITSDTQVSLDSNILTFTSLNWDTPQNVTVTAVNDTDIEGAHNGLIEFAVSSLDFNYDAFVLGDITVGITDNDAEPPSVSSGSSSGYIMPHIRFKNKIKETDSRFVDLQTFAPSTVTYFEISNTPDFKVKESYFREYTQKDLYWDLCKGLNSCVAGEKLVYARFYTNVVGIIESIVSIEYNPKLECPYFKGFLRKDSLVNDPLEVKKAQEFLNRELNIKLEVDGIFGRLTDTAVRNFQDKYPGEILFPWRNLKKSTGWWYITTSVHANWLVGC